MEDKKKGFKQRVKKYFTEKPTQSFWMWAFFYSVIFKWFAPTVLRFYTIFQMGLIMPEHDFTPTMEEVSINLANKFMEIMQRVFETGQKIALDSPLVARMLFHTISYTVVIVYLGVLLILIHLSRYLISWIIRRRLEK